MDNTTAVESVKKALDLSVFIDNTNQELTSLKNQTFKDAPQPPIRNVLSSEYPPINPNTKFWTLALIPAIIFWPWIIIYYFTIYKNNKQADIEAIKNSPEYIKQCQDIDAQTEEKQKNIDEAHQLAMEEYNTQILPVYNQELEAWTSEHVAKVNETETNLNSAIEELKVHYETTKIVPKQYRTIHALEYVYDYISTSDYSVKEALDAYEKNEQMQLEREKLSQQQLANKLAAEQADLLYEQNIIAEKARRDAQISSAINIVQQHNANKISKNGFNNINQTLKNRFK